MRRPPWWLLALLVLMAFAFQGTRGLWEPDEGRYTATGLRRNRVYYFRVRAFNASGASAYSNTVSARTKK